MKRTTEPQFEMPAAARALKIWPTGWSGHVLRFPTRYLGSPTMELASPLCLWIHDPCRSQNMSIDDFVAKTSSHGGVAVALRFCFDFDTSLGFQDLLLMFSPSSQNQCRSILQLPKCIVGSGIVDISSTTCCQWLPASKCLIHVMLQWLIYCPLLGATRHLRQRRCRC